MVAALAVEAPVEAALAEVEEVLEEATDPQQSEARILVQDDLRLDGVRLVEQTLEEELSDEEILYDQDMEDLTVALDMDVLVIA